MSILFLFVALSGNVAFGAAGEFDPSFNGVGFTSERLGNNSSGYELAIHSTGEIVTAGINENPKTGDPELVLWQHLPDGTPDTTFGGTGVVYLLSSGIVFFNTPTLALDNQ